jgi:hypothetical protein
MNKLSFIHKIVCTDIFIKFNLNEQYNYNKLKEHIIMSTIKQNNYIKLQEEILIITNKFNNKLK